MLAEAGATLAQMRALATEIFAQGGFVFFNRGVWRIGVCGSKLRMTILTVMDVAEEVKVMVEEVWYGGSSVSPHDLRKGGGGW